MRPGDQQRPGVQFQKDARGFVLGTGIEDGMRRFENDPPRRRRIDDEESPSAQGLRGVFPDEMKDPSADVVEFHQVEMKRIETAFGRRKISLQEMVEGHTEDGSFRHRGGYEGLGVFLNEGHVRDDGLQASGFEGKNRFAVARSRCRPSAGR